MNPDIKIQEGLSGLTFRCTAETVRAVYGEPDEMEELDNPCDGSLDSIVWSYERHGLNFFFDATEMEPILCTIESDSAETSLFGKKIFRLRQAEIKQLMVTNGYQEPEEDDETWGEHRMTFDDAQVDFYFAGGDLTLVSWSCY